MGVRLPSDAEVSPSRFWHGVWLMIPAYNEAQTIRALAEAALAQCPRAVLVTDIVMPGGMNGLDLAGVVRREFPDVEVVLISAFAGALIDDRTPLPHRMLVKPVSADDLLAALGEPRPVHSAQSGANGP